MKKNLLQTICYDCAVSRFKCKWVRWIKKTTKKKGIIFKITKNRITKIAIKDTPVKELEKYFTGPTAAALSQTL